MSKIQKQIDKLLASKAAAIAAIAAADEALPALQAERAAEVAAEQARELTESTGIPVGTQITFDYGRGETRTTKSGKVLAFRAKSDTVPAAYKVEVGEGFDLDVVTVLAANVKVAA